MRLKDILSKKTASLGAGALLTLAGFGCAPGTDIPDEIDINVNASGGIDVNVNTDWNDEEGEGSGADASAGGIRCEGGVCGGITFRQLDWIGDDGVMRVRDSQVGEVAFDFGANAEQLLDANGGGYVNVTVGGPQGAEWVVQNLYVSYPTIEYMEGSSPSVQFLLPEDGDVVELDYAVTLTAEPSPAADAPLAHAFVESTGFHAGGFNGGGSGLAILDTIGPWVRPWPVPIPVRIARTSEGGDDLPAVDEDVNGCAPASAARSIKYMLGDAADDVQDIYDDLYDDMSTDGTGTSDADMLDGKRAYTQRNDLGIQSDLLYGMRHIQRIMDLINAGHDVEILITWTNARGQSVGGHAAMITNIVQMSDGTYQITYVDDPSQGDGEAENEEHVIIVQPDGSFPGGQVDGFLAEQLLNADAELRPAEG